RGRRAGRDRAVGPPARGARAAFERGDRGRRGPSRPRRPHVARSRVPGHWRRAGPWGYKACGDREKRKGINVTLDDEAADRLRDCVTSGGVAVFPSDTVYGVCCDPDNEEAARRLYALKGRPAARACAVMFFSLADALEVLDDLHESECDALHALLPGPVTVLLANREQRFAPACRVDPATLGLRVPNLSGEPDARTLDAIPERLLESVDLVIDGGELPGTPSTVIDLRELDEEHRW